MIRVTRTLVYEGEEDWVRDTLRKSYIQPDNFLILCNKSIIELERKEEEVEKDG